MRRPINILLLTILTLITATLYIGCDGGGDSGAGVNSRSTTINGRIVNLVTASTDAESVFNLALIKKLISLIKEAKAQDGISVIAIVDGVTADTDVTDADGRFTLILELESATNVSIVFLVNGVEVSIDIFVEQGSLIEISINIDLGAEPGEEVQIVDMEDEQGPISCETGSIEILKNPNEDLIINGRGEDCIRTAGNCNLTIDPENIVLTNCENCVDARGTSDVTILSPNGDIVCESSEDGFRSRGNAHISVEALGTIEILAGDNGAKADGNASITLLAELCVIDSSEDPVDENGNAVVDISGCLEVLVDPTPLPSPFPMVTPAPTPGP